MCIAIECSYKLDQKNEFKFLCELCTFSQIRSHISSANIIALLRQLCYMTKCHYDVIMMNYHVIEINIIPSLVFSHRYGLVMNLRQHHEL